MRGEIISNGYNVCRDSRPDPTEGRRTIFVSHTLANCHAGLLVGILQDHDLSQLDAEPGSSLVSPSVEQRKRRSPKIYEIEHTGPPRAGPALDGCCQSAT